MRKSDTSIFDLWQHAKNVVGHGLSVADDTMYSMNNATNLMATASENMKTRISAEQEATTEALLLKIAKAKAKREAATPAESK